MRPIAKRSTIPDVLRAWLIACGMAACPAWVLACGSSGSDGGPAPAPCTSAMVPPTVHLTVSGFQKCTCFNGIFPLTQSASGPVAEPDIWASAPIMGCPGQTEAAYLKFSIETNAFGIGIEDIGSDPGSGNGDFSPATGGACSPLSVRGGGSEAGNIDSFCPGNEDLYMSWSVGP